jgi:Ca-activated chloride channel homolog
VCRVLQGGADGADLTYPAVGLFGGLGQDLKPNNADPAVHLAPLSNSAALPAPSNPRIREPRHNKGVTPRFPTPFMLALICAAALAVSAQDQPTPKFKAGVAVVPVTAVVRDSGGRLVRDLTRDDFQVFEDGVATSIVDFRSTAQVPISIALLLDTSSSMRDANEKQAGAVISALLAAMSGSDEAALFTFDKTLRQETPFTRDDEVIQQALSKTVMWGQTSLYDAIADTAKRLSEQPSQRRAVVVITDGQDTSSARTPADVSGLASSFDVPVYVVAVAPKRRWFGGGNSQLTNLARLTGGEQVQASNQEQLTAAVETLLGEMRQQYFLAIDASLKPGWHRLEVKTRKRGLTVRARSGYTAVDPNGKKDSTSPR